MFIATMNLKTKFGSEYSVLIDKSPYMVGNMQTCLTAIEKSGQVFAKLTVNLVDEMQKAGEVFIKNYSENAGFMEQLIAEGIISQPKRRIEKQYIDIYVCDLLK
ncbi:MAG: hypothetical protein ABIP51_18125 [Bacteroidia bacterium]